MAFLLQILFFAALFALLVGFLRDRGGTLGGEEDLLKRVERDAERTSLFYGMSPRQAESYRDGQAIGVCFARFAIRVASADGAFDQRDYQAILRFFSGAHPAYASYIQGILEHDLAAPETIDWAYNLEAARRILAKPGFKGFEAVLLDGLIMIAAADGVVEPGERESILGIMAELGWARERVEAHISARLRGGRPGGEQSRAASGGIGLDEAYRVLGLNPGASIDEAKRRYRELAKANHPDLFAQMGSGVQAAAAKRFREVQEAWERIKEASA
jgi:DnaJ like chaperone protein